MHPTTFFVFWGVLVFTYAGGLNSGPHTCMPHSPLNHICCPRSRLDGDLEASEDLFGSDSLTGPLWAAVMPGTAVAVNRHVGAVQMAGLGHTVTAERRALLAHEPSWFKIASWWQQKQFAPEFLF